jgi:Hemerythrin HHE cation binding domain
MSIYDELKADHDKAKSVLQELLESKQPSRSKQKIFEELKRELTVHFRAEEKVFYNRIKEEKEAKDSVLEGNEEHHMADLLLKEISRLGPSDERWKAKLTVLKEAVEHHIEEEESEIWSEAREILSDEEADEIGEAFAAEKEKRLAKAA